MVKINGESISADGKRVLEYLEEIGKDPAHVAVMVNGEILPKAEYENYVMNDGNEVEIIGFVGGG